MAPVLALVLTVLVTLAWPSGGEIVGVLAVAAGVLLVRGGRREAPRRSRRGLVVACVIAGYTVVDRYGIRHANAAPYLLLVMLGPRSSTRSPSAVAVWRGRSHRRRS